MGLYGPQWIYGSSSTQLWFFPNTKVMFFFGPGVGYDNHTISIKYSIDGGAEQTRNDVMPVTSTFNGKTYKTYDGLLRITQSLSFGKHTIKHAERDVTSNTSWTSYQTETFYIVDTNNISAGTSLTPKNFLIYCGFIANALDIMNPNNNAVSSFRGSWTVTIYPYIENPGSGQLPKVGNII